MNFVKAVSFLRESVTHCRVRAYDITDREKGGKTMYCGNNGGSWLFIILIAVVIAWLISGNGWNFGGCGCENNGCGGCLGNANNGNGCGCGCH